MKTWLRRILLLSGALLAGVILYYLLTYAIVPPAGTVKPIADGPFARLIPARQRLVRYHPVDFSAPVAHVPVPQHPFMAANPGSNMHNDGSMSDTAPAAGPRGANPSVHSRTQGFGGYGTLTFNRQGQIVAVFSSGRQFQLELLEPYSLQELASYDLPPRPASLWLEGVPPWEYIGAGTYFYLDHLERAIVPTTRNTVQVVQTPGTQSGAGFELLREYDLSAAVVPLPWPQQDSVAWVLPDWDGGAYWFATTAGMVGVIDAETGAVQTLRLADERIENSFAIGPEGVFVISDRALYRFSRSAGGQITTDWRSEYDRGPRQKPGLITRGSGSSVTLLGGSDGFVAVSDNAEPRIHLLFLRRSDGAVVCQEPLFEPGRSATDITVIGFQAIDPTGSGTALYSAIVENNWGHHSFPRARPAPGISRVDLAIAADGTAACKTVWTSPEKNIGVFKMSLESGLIYTYFRDDSLAQKWYWTALDYHTGETVYQALAGTGLGYNNWAGAIFLHPAGGTAYSTTLFGLVQLRDRSP